MMKKIRTKKTSKFIREYGMTQHQLADKYNIDPSTLYLIHLKGELHQFIEEQEKEKVGVSK